MSWVELTNVGAMAKLDGALPKTSTAPCVKFVPVIVTVIGGEEPEGTLEGLIDVTVGTIVGMVIWNGRDAEGPPPGAGLDTVT